jgi:8-demethyl-8-alpha-L-rhamnosyltetracenomycin-C 2'-O-methyltransferase
MNTQQTLKEIFAEIGNNTGIDIGGNDKGGIHSYLETYDKLFDPFRNGCTILEIGLAMGDSIKLWDRYFKNSKIIGCDISVVFDIKDVTGHGNDNLVEIIQADATKAEFLETIKDHSLDLVVEDASHMEADSVAIFELLKTKMNKGGIYIVEDILSLDYSRPTFEKLHPNCEIIDMRHTGRFDNVLIIYKF